MATMRKVFMGVRLRRLREERKLTQIGLARMLGLSPSYLNQIEQNQRPLTMSVLRRLSEVFKMDVNAFSDDEQTRMIAALHEVAATLPASALGGHEGDRISQAEIHEIATNMPAVGRVLIDLHRRHREAAERLEAMTEKMTHQNQNPGSSTDALLIQTQPYEEARDFFFTHHNYFAQLDVYAEQCHTAWGLADVPTPGLADRLEQRLREQHGVIVNNLPAEKGLQRAYNPTLRQLSLPPYLTPGQRAFQMGTQLAFLELDTVLERMVDAPRFSSQAVRKLVRLGLANYFAAALILPYRQFLAAAEQLQYDIDLLGQRFGVSFETVCHRLSTMQRPDATGVPFFFIRVDRAGNISKRQSAAHFHFSRVGGACPLWNVYEAFSSPGRILRQLARMPDGRVYLWIARTVCRQTGGFGQPSKDFAVALGCDIAHAHRLVYAKGLDFSNPDIPTPIGMGCRVCERPQCAQRAFPYIGRELDVNENLSSVSPYPMNNP